MASVFVGGALANAYGENGVAGANGGRGGAPNGRPHIVLISGVGLEGEGLFARAAEEKVVRAIACLKEGFFVDLPRVKSLKPRLFFS